MAGFGNTPVTTTQSSLPGNQFPLSSVAVPGHTSSNLTALEGGPASTDSNGNETAPASVYSKDGANITMGLIADAATVGDTSGTLSAKLRGLTKILNDIWDSVNHHIHVNVDNANLNGQATMSNSSPVAIASDQSSVKTKSDFIELASLSAGSLNADLVPSTDVSAYKSLSLHLNSNAWAGTLTFQCSNDNSNWTPLFLMRQDAPGQSQGQNAVVSQTNVLYSGNIAFHYLRIRMTNYTSGTAQGTLDLFTHTYDQVVGTIAQAGSWTMQPGNTPNTTPWLITYSNNNASVPSGASNTVVKASPGAIAGVVITTAGSVAGPVVIYDNASTNSGTPLTAFAANEAVGTYHAVRGWAKNGITAANVASGPVFTVYYA